MTPMTMAFERAQVVDDKVRFDTPDGFANALRQGCFLLEIPHVLDVSPGIRLCREFYRPTTAEDKTAPSYRGFRHLKGIYFDREHFQTEHLLLDGPGRARHFPGAVQAMCNQMNQLALLVLCATLRELGIAEELWSRITGGAVDGHGTHWFAASHYRPERDQLGCAPHKDTGFVTILYIDQPGLEAAVGDGWMSIAPVPGYFVVNFGGAFELLTKQLDRPVQAMLHRVRQCIPHSGVEDRFSFAAFANPPAASDLYQVGAHGSVLAVQTVEEFLRDFNARTWNDRHEDFGIVVPASQAVPGTDVP